MQKILDKYNDLYSAMAGHIKESKTKYYLWKRNQKQGKKVIQQK